ncbi:MAG: S-layer homology domain-containing protein, partial [Sporomusa sp.]
YPDGTFRPENSITRAEVVTIVNHMLDRAIDDDALSKVENPYIDITSDHWAFADIIEASVDHEYTRDDDGNEIWQSW